MAPHLLLRPPSLTPAPWVHRRHTTCGLRPACLRPLLGAPPLALPAPLPLEGGIRSPLSPSRHRTCLSSHGPNKSTQAATRSSSPPALTRETPESAPPSPSPSPTFSAPDNPPMAPSPSVPPPPAPRRSCSSFLAAALATLLLLTPSPADAAAFPGSVGLTLRGHSPSHALPLRREVGPTEDADAAGGTPTGTVRTVPRLESDPVHRAGDVPLVDTTTTSQHSDSSGSVGSAVGALSALSPYASPDAVRIPLPALEVDPREEYVRAGVRPDVDLEDALELSGVRLDAGGIPTTEPQQVHISLWGPKRMLVTWVTSDHSAPSVVDYGTAPGDLPRTATGTAESYSYVIYRSGIVHRVVLGTDEDPLKPDTTYFYRCGKEGREMSFKTPPDRFPLNVAIVGDLGQTGWTVSTLEHIEEQPHDMLVLPGDLSYADRYQPRWDSWGHLVEPLASRRPWMVVAGNHEEEDIPLLEPERFKAYNTRWPLPAAASPVPSASNLYYSFETAGVHWVMLASYDDFSPDSEQYQWLERDLAAVDRRRTPWLVAVLHAPWYNSNSAHQGDGEAMRRSMEGVLYAHGTDLLFAGHVHAYERSAPVFDGDADPCGIVHVTIGDGGNYEGLATRYLEPQPEWSLMREASFGHGELVFHEDGSADWSWHRNQDDESVTADAVRLFPYSMRVKSQGERPVMCTASK